ncbi:TPA: hypothetical protein JIE61_002420 [Acinetobacter baumannii]|nr:hypothetical protein [Acinetobacter baumannii]HAV3642817.1 hypothetical protein [Acinetobacter baumannii]HAV7123425.1 hypothetical protein [Acinetobacter baumannii]HCW3744530.1 hypothetical protein [Acinetobacter baumannii]
MLEVQPDHPIAIEAYEAVKAMKCEYIRIVAQPYQKTPTETGYFINGIYPSDSEKGMNRTEWLKCFEEKQGGN